MSSFFSGLKNLLSKKEDYYLEYFEVHLADHCNLNCRSCLHFSPLSKENYADIKTFENDFKRLSEITAYKVDAISLMGGEPLLNPNCKNFFRIARKYFPNTNIQFVTNGILLNSQNEYFWEEMSHNNITLRPTVYPIEIDWEKIKQKVRQYKINLDFYNSPNYPKTSYKVPININGGLNARKNFKNCKAKGCVMLSEGKLYPCSIPSNIHNLIDYFNLNIPLKNNGIDIYEVKNLKQIEKFMNTPIPLCEYCNGSNLTYLGRWRKSNKNINEWIE